MKPQLFATSIVALATFAVSAVSASAQTEPMSTVQQVAETRSVGFLDVSPRLHDDWAVAPILTLDVSPRSHDDWAVTPAAFPLDLSPASHDDWAL